MASYTIEYSFEVNQTDVTPTTFTVEVLSGKDGTDGTDGTNGAGVPVGGTADQVLTKIDGTDYNTEWRDASGGGGGLVYREVGLIDAQATNVWVYEQETTSVSGEYNSSTGVGVLSSPTTILAATLRNARPFAIATKDQTVDSLKMYFGKLGTNVTQISLVKVRFSASHTVIDSISSIIERGFSNPVVVGSDGYLEFTNAIDFDDINISDKDILFLFFRSGTTANLGPCVFELNTTPV